ncbi:MAG: HlyD family efflux transporter periplasmic adaptor subunit [Acidobacteria bacterium]|nr:HlyD family efflux transporter periplasmic adaptor subunit [Acidobacteriota bacterium]
MNRRHAGESALIFLISIAGVSCTLLKDYLPVSKTESEIPTTLVVREPVDVRIHTIGELHPVRSSMIVAPPVAGGTLQIISIVKTGTRVQKGDIVVEFDPSEQEYNLEQSRSQLEEAEQGIKKMQADQAVRVAREKVSLLKAESDVRRAELKIQGNALLSKIEARKNEIGLEEARRRLEQMQRDIQSNASSDAADLAVQNVARSKAMLAMNLAQQNIDKMTQRAPIDGIVVVGQNLEALLSGSGSVRIYSGMEIPEFSQGDQASPGRLVAQIQDSELMEIRSKVIETDRGNLAPGQPVEIWLDSRPMKPFNGRIKSLGSSAFGSANASTTLELLESLSTRSFDAIFELDPDGEQLKLGVTARITIQGENVENALSLPRQAVFQKDGRPIVYVKDAENWNIQNVQIKHLTESRAILEGLDEGTEVALVNPDPGKRGTAEETKPVSPVLGGVNP